MKLADHEIQAAAFVGVQRRISGLGRPDRVPGIVEVRGGWDTDVEGAIAEIAYARATGTYWDLSVGTFARHDVSGIQVKHTDGLEGRRCLILRPEHDERDLYALVVGRDGEYEVYAPISGGEIKRIAPIRDPGQIGRACWMLPKHQLQRIA